MLSFSQALTGRSSLFADSAGRRVPGLRNGRRVAGAHFEAPPPACSVSAAGGAEREPREQSRRPETVVDATTTGADRDGPEGRARLAQDRPQPEGREPLALAAHADAARRDRAPGALRAARAPGVLGGRGRDRDGGREQGRRAERRDADPDRLRLRRGAAQGRRLRQDPGPPLRAARRGGLGRARGRDRSRGWSRSTTRPRSRAPGPPCCAPRPTSPSSGASCAWRTTWRSRRSSREDQREAAASRVQHRRGAARAGAGRPRLLRGAAPEHGDPRALQRGRGQEDGRGGGERRADPAGREHLHLVGRDRRARRPSRRSRSRPTWPRPTSPRSRAASRPR